jgi:outer membrane receptor for ferrienterochelin and colicins
MKSATWLFLLLCALGQAQNDALKGRVTDQAGTPLPFALITVAGGTNGVVADENGHFVLGGLAPGAYVIKATATGWRARTLKVNIPSAPVEFRLHPLTPDLSEIVVTGTMKEISKDESPVNIDVVTPALFQKTSTPNLFEATSLVNGVKPQINCNVCNTGDIHINGLEGPYTLILIDGMPIVSGLSSVYGLMGIPASMIERLEIAKGPASALYGSESMGGTINLITKRPSRAPRFYADYYGTSYLENSLDLGGKTALGKKADWLIGANGYYYDDIKDINKDGFTDVTLQKRASLFNKVSFFRNDDREFSIAGRYVYEDRWGGQTGWTPKFRGGDSIYGESIYTSRAELISKYQWPLREKIFTQLSYNFHDHNSVYGNTPFMARQSTAFAQTYWNKQIGSRQDLLVGVNFKNLWFDDNTVITQAPDSITNKPENTNTYGLFAQDEIALDTLSKHKLLLGLRLDYNDVYNFVPSPRIAYKWSPKYSIIYRLNFGTGFRIVNVFTEDHAALTGAREVMFLERIRPETSYNGSFNMVYKMKIPNGAMLVWDGTLFYYHFTNKIFANYDIDPEKVIYENLDGYAFSRGFSLSASLASTGNLKFTLGTTYADVQNVIRDMTGAYTPSRQLQAPLWSGNIIVGYNIPEHKLKLDVTGNWYGPQRLPIFPNDFRPEYSPWFCLLNFQATKSFGAWELYAGVKNLLNFIPEDPIMRPHDPFDKRADDAASNPNGYTFDPSYNYAPIQGIRAYGGIRISIQ